MDIEQHSGTPSIKGLIKRFWHRAILTWSLVLMEALALVLIPLAIGWAVDDLLSKEFSGTMRLAGLCGVLLLIGAGRRFYDTRAYSHIYRVAAYEVVKREQGRKSPVSTVSARLNLFGEFIEFLEGALPGILHESVNLIGTLLLILLIDARVAALCGGATVLTIVVYAITEKRIYNLNSGQNEEFERQVAILENKDDRAIQLHLKNLTVWRIRLSDLETINYSIIWIGLSVVLVLASVTLTVSGKASTGEIVAALMYVFGYMESILAFPMYYQQVVRLR